MQRQKSVTLWTGVVLCLLLVACGGGSGTSSLNRFLSAEDNAVIELLDALRKNPSDKSLLELLPSTYDRAMQSRTAMQGYVLRDNPPGDRWVLWRRQLEASQSITDMVLAFPQAAAVIARPVYFRDQISEARTKAADEYYNEAMQLMRQQNRQDARRAIELFNKATREIPNYRDVANQIRMAEQMATLWVVVNPVDYYSFGWNYWGFQNDYLQWQMLRDLNNRSFRMTRFVSEQEARSMRIVPERVVDMRFARLMVTNPFTERNSFDRQKEIVVQETNPPSRPPNTVTKPVTTPPQTITVRARVTITRELVNGDADLQCRIYDVRTGRNILFDNFPGRYNWVFESASFTGDRRALTDSDLRLLNNRFERYPTREEVARKLIDDAYGLLIRRIEQGVNFDTW
jgi:hypothetical protein